MNDDIYLTDEEMENMSEEEIIKNVMTFNEALLKAQESGELVMPKITLDDIDKAYESDEYKEFLEETKDDDIASKLFDDREDVDEINSYYEALMDLKEGALKDEKIKIYNDMYPSLYHYIRRVNPLWEAGADRLDVWAGLQEDVHTVFTLKPESATSFKELCTPDIFATIGKENVYSFGSVRRIEGKDRACGIIIFEVHPKDEDNIETVAEIKWLYVDENYRGKHVGDELMAAMYHALSKAGIKAVCTDIPMKDMLPATVGDFLSKWWIFFKLEPRAKACITLAEIMEGAKGVGRVRPDGFMKMSSMGEEVLKEGIETILKNTGEPALKLTDTESLEQDLSMIRFVNGKPNCFILMDKMPSGMLKVRRLSGNAKDDKHYLELISFVAAEALKKYPPETPVIIEPVSDMSVELFEHLYPNVGTPLYLAGANISFEGGLTSEMFEELYFMYKNGMLAKS